jgi:hypothetical protein
MQFTELTAIILGKSPVAGNISKRFSFSKLAYNSYSMILALYLHFMVNPIQFCLHLASMIVRCLKISSFCQYLLKFLLLMNCRAYSISGKEKNNLGAELQIVTKGLQKVPTSCDDDAALMLLALLLLVLSSSALGGVVN